MQSPWMHRARHKPLGYLGDFEMMNGLYGNHFAGSTLFAKARQPRLRLDARSGRRANAQGHAEGAARP